MPETPVAHQRVLDAAARKGVTLEIVTFPESTHTAAEAAPAVGAELGQIVKSLVFVAPEADGTLTPYLVLASGANRVDSGVSPRSSAMPASGARAPARRTS